MELDEYLEDRIFLPLQDDNAQPDSDVESLMSREDPPTPASNHVQVHSSPSKRFFKGTVTPSKAAPFFKPRLNRNTQQSTVTTPSTSTLDSSPTKLSNHHQHSSPTTSPSDVGGSGSGSGRVRKRVRLDDNLLQAGPSSSNAALATRLASNSYRLLDRDDDSDEDSDHYSPSFTHSPSKPTTSSSRLPPSDQPRIPSHLPNLPPSLRSQSTTSNFSSLFLKMRSGGGIRGPSNHTHSQSTFSTINNPTLSFNHTYPSKPTSILSSTSYHYSSNLDFLDSFSSCPLNDAYLLPSPNDLEWESMLNFTPKTISDEVENPLDEDLVQQRSLELALDRDRSLGRNWGRIDEVGRSETLCSSYSNG